jgi:hypothetical protein
MAEFRVSPYPLTADGMVTTGSSLLYGLTWSWKAGNASLGVYAVGKATTVQVSCRKLLIYGGCATGHADVALATPALFSTGIFCSMTSNAVATFWVARRK